MSDRPSALPGAPPVDHAAAKADPALEAAGRPKATGPKPERAARHVLVSAAGLTCGLPIECVRETMRPLRLEPLEARQRAVVGLAVIRGAPVPVVDLALLLGRSPPSSYGRFVVVAAEGSLAALAVERVAGIADLDPGSIGRLPSLVDSCDSDAVGRLSVADASLTLVLERSRILRDPSETVR